MTDFAGNYPIELRKGEIERLLVQSEAMAPETEAMLDRLGSMQGWSCLDIGCGPGGITGLLSERVGSAGCVMGIDTDARFLEYARKTAPANVEFRLANAFGSDLPEASFDFVHMRFVASTSGQPEMLLREAIRLAKPGGIVALQEPDGSTLNCFPPHKSWDTLKEIYIAVFKGVGADIQLARRLYHLACQTELLDVQYRTSVLAVRPGDPMIDYLPSTAESLRETITRLELSSERDLNRLFAECRQHLRQRGSSFTMYTLAQVWGRKPAPKALTG